jgi:hypothetical protein
VVDSTAEEGGVEVINNLLSGSMLGSSSSSENCEGYSEELDKSNRSSIDYDVMASYSSEIQEEFKDETDFLAKNGSEESSSIVPAKSVSHQSTATLPGNEVKKDNAKNVLFMKKIEEMTRKRLNEQQDLSRKHVSFIQEAPELKSPKTNARLSMPMRACESPRAAMKRMSINNIVGDESAKRCYMPSWESRMNSVDKEYLEGRIKTMASGSKLSNVAKRSEESQDDAFFSEIRQKAANKPTVDPFPNHSTKIEDGLKKHDLPVTEPTSEEDVVEKEFKVQQKLWRSADLRKAKEKQMEESMSNSYKKTSTLSDIPPDEMKAWAAKYRKEEEAPEPFDEYKAQSLSITYEVPTKPSTTKLLDSTYEPSKPSTEKLLDRSQLSNKKKQNKPESSKTPSSLDSLAGSMKEHAKRITELEAKTLHQYSNAAKTITNPNPSPSSLRSLSTNEKDHQMVLRRRVVELEAEALRKHSEAALAALHARQALDKMIQQRNKNKSDKNNEGKLNDSKNESKIEDLPPISSSLSTIESKEEECAKCDESTDETSSHQSYSVESASVSQYSGRYEHRQHVDNVIRQEVVLTPRGSHSRTESRHTYPPTLNARSRAYSSDDVIRQEVAFTPRGSHSRPVSRHPYPPALNARSRAYSSEYHREEEKGHYPPCIQSSPGSRMPPNIMLPSLHSPEAKAIWERVHRASPRHSVDKASRPHLMPYAPRTTPVRDTQIAFASLPYSPSLAATVPHANLYRNGNNTEHINSAPSPYKYLTSMTPRTVQEQQRFEFSDNQVASRNFDSMMLASNQTVQERMMNQQHPMMNFSGNCIAPEQMIRQQRPRVDLQEACFNPATQSSHIHSHKVRYANPYETSFGGETSCNGWNHELWHESRHDHPSIRYDGASMRW